MFQKGVIQFPGYKQLPLSLIKRKVKSQIGEDSEIMKKDVLSGVLHEVPEDVEKALKANNEILERWNRLTPIQRNEWICWITIVKKKETRAEHILRMIEELKEGKRNPCCWPGCPHRRPLAQKWFKNVSY
jgi:hypothetical protein